MVHFAQNTCQRCLQRPILAFIVVQFLLLWWINHSSHSGATELRQGPGSQSALPATTEAVILSIQPDRNKKNGDIKQGVSIEASKDKGNDVLDSAAPNRTKDKDTRYIPGREDHLKSSIQPQESLINGSSQVVDAVVETVLDIELLGSQEGQRGQEGGSTTYGPNRSRFGGKENQPSKQGETHNVTTDRPKIQESSIALTPNVSLGSENLTWGGMSLFHGGSSMCLQETNTVMEKHKLGKGTFGKVYPAHIDVVFKTHQDEGIEVAENKAVAMAELHHPHILRFIAMVMDGSKPLGFLLEHFSNTTMADFMQERRNSSDAQMRTADVVSTGLQIAFALDYLHARGIYGADLNPKSIQANRTSKGDFFVKLQDVPPPLSTTTTGRTLLAPDVNQPLGLDPKEDVFHLGVLLLEMMGVPINDQVPIDSIKGADPEVVGIVEECTKSDPSQRPTAIGLMNKFAKLWWKKEKALPLESRLESSELFKGTDNGSSSGSRALLKDHHGHSKEVEGALQTVNCVCGTHYRGVQSIAHYAAQVNLGCPIDRAPVAVDASDNAILRVSKHEIEVENYKPRTGRVFKASYKVAVKMFKKRFRSGNMKEIMIQSSLRHPNVAPFLGAAVESDEGRWVAKGFMLELFPDGGLDTLIEETSDRSSKPIPFDVRLQIAKQVAAAMHYLHTKDVIHFDLKPSNVLLKYFPNERYPVAKVTDFGLSLIKTNTTIDAATNAKSRVRGTRRYAAPELFTSPEFADEKADVYSFGAMLWKMYTGESPYNELSQDGVLDAWRDKGLPSLHTRLPDSCEEEWKMLVKECTRVLPRQRWSMPDAIKFIDRVLERLNVNTAGKVVTAR